jgi:hypothetical protein
LRVTHGGLPLAVDRMAIDSDKVNQSVTKGKAVIVLHLTLTTH